jgi:hypothetical protein
MTKREWIITDSLQKCKNQDVTRIDSLNEEYSCPYRKPSHDFLIIADRAEWFSFWVFHKITLSPLAKKYSPPPRRIQYLPYLFGSLRALIWFCVDIFLPNSPYEGFLGGDGIILFMVLLHRFLFLAKGVRR